MTDRYLAEELTLVAPRARKQESSLDDFRAALRETRTGRADKTKVQGSASTKEMVLRRRRERRAAGRPLPNLTDASAGSVRDVVKREGGWAVVTRGSQRASSVHSTQKQAIAAARGALKASGGGQLAVHGRDGAIRDQDTVAAPKSSRARS